MPGASAESILIPGLDRSDGVIGLPEDRACVSR